MCPDPSAKETKQNLIQKDNIMGGQGLKETKHQNIIPGLALIRWQIIHTFFSGAPQGLPVQNFLTVKQKILISEE